MGNKGGLAVCCLLDRCYWYTGTSVVKPAVFGYNKSNRQSPILPIVGIAVSVVLTLYQLTHSTKRNEMIGRVSQVIAAISICLPDSPNALSTLARQPPSARPQQQPHDNGGANMLQVLDNIRDIMYNARMRR
jgi:hypothetical protein